MKKLFSIALILFLSITFVSAAQGVCLEQHKETPIHNVSLEQSNLDIAAVQIAELDTVTIFATGESHLFILDIHLNDDSTVSIDYEKLKSITKKHLNYNGDNPIIAIFFPDSYCLSLYKINRNSLANNVYLPTNKRILFSLNKVEPTGKDSMLYNVNTFSNYLRILETHKSFANKAKPVSISFC